MMDSLLSLLKRVAALKRAPKSSRGKYPASSSPYKPILLLAVLRRIQQGETHYSKNEILYIDCKRDFQSLYATLYGTTSDIDSKVVQAFWYLGTGKPRIWDLSPKAGMETDLAILTASRAQIKTAPKLNRLVSSARFTAADWFLLQDVDVQQALISFLIFEHFVDVRHAVERL
jgi:predicted restriction endonuclease